MLELASPMWPVLARWRTPEDEGTVTWVLAGLGADRRFWGYVHFRTPSRQENRSFSGTLDEETFHRVASLIQQMVEHADPDSQTEASEGLVGIGTRSSFRRIFGIGKGVAEPDDGSVIRAYHDFLNLMQPKLSASILQ